MVGTMDTLSEEQRSYNMSLIRSKNTKPERTVRSVLHRMGRRFTVNGPKNKSLPGKPDLVLPKLKTVIFVHGCFWHGHGGCKDHRIPKTRTAWWKDKIEGNAARDLRNQARLRDLGWHVVVVWSCEFKTTEGLEALPARLEAAIEARNLVISTKANGPDRHSLRSKRGKPAARKPPSSPPSRRQKPPPRRAR